MKKAKKYTYVEDMEGRPKEKNSSGKILFLTRENKIYILQATAKFSFCYRVKTTHATSFDFSKMSARLLLLQLRCPISYSLQKRASQKMAFVTVTENNSLSFTLFVQTGSVSEPSSCENIHLSFLPLVKIVPVLVLG